MSDTYGEVKRAVYFNLDKPEEKELYDFSFTIKLAPLVKQYLRAELQRRRSQSQSKELNQDERQYLR